MPLISDDGGRVLDADELSFRGRVRAGRAVPIISDEVLFDLAVGSHADLVESYAGYVKYALSAPADLVRLAKYHKYRPRRKPLRDQALKSDYFNWVKNHIYRVARAAETTPNLLDEAEAQIDRLSVTDFAKGLDMPFYADGANPLLVLANLPFKIILTTSPFTFIESALFRAGKRPRTEVCHWRQDLRQSIGTTIDRNYQPSAQSPLVYHLLGLDRYPDSLVLTEDDFLEYLVTISQFQGNHATDVVPALVRKALSDDLIVLGYRLDSWAFRVLYAGLIKPNARQEDRGVCNILLPDNPVERGHLEDYVNREAKFDVFWGDIHKYAEELRNL